MASTLKQILSTYLAVFVLSLMTGILVSMIISTTTETMTKVGLVVLLAGIGYLLSLMFVRLARGYERERQAIHAVAPLLSIVVIVPPLVAAALFGLL
jgi:heme/copper-type cytochrome/quinol oxidase subunit 4